MQILSNNTGPDCGKSLFSAIECFSGLIQPGWSDASSTVEGQQSLIESANKSINLLDYLQTKLNLEETNSSSGWTYKTICPFHKHGQERTASFFINVDQNRFYCQACNISGGISEYIAYTFKRPVILVAEHILKCTQGNFQIDEANIKKTNEKKKFQAMWLKLSELYRIFMRNHLNDDDAFVYVNKCFSGLDNIMEERQEETEKVIDEIYYKFENYLKKYDGK